jgi:RNA polymerase sigma-70 factor, ECF subfamily
MSWYQPPPPWGSPAGARESVVGPPGSTEEPVDVAPAPAREGADAVVPPDPARGRAAEPATVTPADLRRIVEAARRGDRSAMDELVRLTYDDTYTLAYRLTGNEDDARDVVQDAYLRAYRSLRRFRGDAQFTTWLYRITANCAANLLAKRARTRTELLLDDVQIVDIHADHDPEGRVAGEDERVRVAGALAGLPWRLRQVIVLRDIYDLPHRSIANELGITEAAAKVRLHRARVRMREVLAGEFGDTRKEGRVPTLPGGDAGEEATNARAS